MYVIGRLQVCLHDCAARRGVIRNGCFHLNSLHLGSYLHFVYCFVSSCSLILWTICFRLL